MEYDLNQDWDASSDGEGSMSDLHFRPSSFLQSVIGSGSQSQDPEFVPSSQLHDGGDVTNVTTANESDAPPVALVDEPVRTTEPPNGPRGRGRARGRGRGERGAEQNIDASTINKSRWKEWEVLVLCECKTKVKDRWQLIASMCHAQNVLRTATQCQDKWEKVQAAFNKIYDYERRRESGKLGYFQMNTLEQRVAHQLGPDAFSKEIYDKMVALFAGESSTNPDSFTIDSGNVESTQVEGLAPPSTGPI